MRKTFLENGNAEFSKYHIVVSHCVCVHLIIFLANCELWFWSFLLVFNSELHILSIEDLNILTNNTCGNNFSIYILLFNT